MKFPLIQPNPPKLSGMHGGLRTIELSGTYSNNGPMVRAFETQAVERLFSGEGACLAVANATLGLMIALREAVAGAPAGRFVVMPAFTFAATAQAALWAGFTPLLCDSDPADWSASAKAEDRLLAQHGAGIAAILPYATFGIDLDLDRYARIARRRGIGVVIDAAASLGTRNARGGGFGAGSPFALVYSMHATKTFAVGEAGLIYSADTDRVDRLRAMANFGFASGRSATLPGLNAKMSEVPALQALAKLAEIDAVCDHRARLTECYRSELVDFELQAHRTQRQAMQFMPLLLPQSVAGARDGVITRLAAEGIGAGHYFSPHLAEQPYFRETCRFGALPVADDISARMLSLPITDAMSETDVRFICATLCRIVDDLSSPVRARRSA